MRLGGLLEGDSAVLLGFPPLCELSKAVSQNLYANLKQFRFNEMLIWKLSLHVGIYGLAEIAVTDGKQAGEVDLNVLWHLDQLWEDNWNERKLWVIGWCRTGRMMCFVRFKSFKRSLIHMHLYGSPYVHCIDRCKVDRISITNRFMPPCAFVIT